MHAKKKKGYAHFDLGVIDMYIACEEMNFMWTNEEVKAMTEMWDAGISVVDMANYFKRTPEETLLLIIDRNKKGRLKTRKRGIFGD